MSYRIALLLVLLGPIISFAQSPNATTQAQGLFREGYQLLQERKLDESIAKFESGLRLDSTSSAAAMAHSYLADIYFNRNDDASAKSHYQEVIRLAPQSEQAASARTRLAAITPSTQPVATVQPNTAPQHRLPQCSGSYNAANWTNCTGEWSDKWGTYVGEFQNGKPNGQGVMTYTDGQKNSGSFEDGFLRGHGRAIYPNGRTFVGEFSAGIGDMQGTMTYPDGSKYVGEYKHYKYDGHGTVYNRDGSVRWGGIWESGNLVERKQ